MAANAKTCMLITNKTQTHTQNITHSATFHIKLSKNFLL